MSRQLVLSCHELPPSDDAIRTIKYFYAGGKRRYRIGYTKEAENYKKTFNHYVSSRYFLEIQEFVRAHSPANLYELSIELEFPAEAILNKGWLTRHKDGTRGAQGPFKKMDVSNRRKLLTDCLAEVTGIDDSLFWVDRGVKLCVSRDDTPAVFLILEPLDPLTVGVPSNYLEP